MKKKENFESGNINIKKYFSIIVLIITIILTGLIIYSNFFHHNSKEVIIRTHKDVLSNMTAEEKKILNIEQKEEEKEQEELQERIEEETNTEEYKKYEELPEEEKEKLDVIPRKEEVPIDEIDEIIDDTDKEIAIPAKFDLRDTISIKVDDQKEYGLCWAFASFNALETHLELTKKKTYDFSEIHLDYIESTLLYGWRNVHEGGSWEVFKNYFSVSGPVSEKISTYDDQPEEVYKKFLDTDSDIIITKAVSFPAIRKGENATSEEDTKKIRDAIKRHIMQNGGVYATINTQGTENQFSKEGLWGNHAITLIGWDDNYPKEKFVDIMTDSEKKEPEKDGAYIALNSWGESWGFDGYFYISYEDGVVETDVNGIISTNIEDAHKIKDIKSDKIKNYIKENYKIDIISYNGEEYITDFALSKNSTLDLSNMNLSNEDLSDIALFSKITSLYLSNNNLNSLNNLPELARLSYINLSNNNINDFTKLSKLPELTFINLNNNNISDLSTLQNLNQLIEIELKNNNITDITALVNLKELGNIDLENNNIKDVSPLSNKELWRLNLNGNIGVTGYGKILVDNLYLNNCDINELNDMSSNNKLSLLEIANNPGITINNGYLPSNINTLNASGNNLSNLQFIENINTIYDLNVSNNNLTDLKDLSGKGNKVNEFGYSFNIDISNNPITNIDVLNEYNSVALNYSNTSNVDLNIFKNLKTIWSLDLSNDNITDLKDFSIGKIHSLNLSKNKEIKNLEILDNNDALFVLYLNDCNITELNEIIKLNDINYLSLDSNEIKDVSPLNKMKGLEVLSISNNPNLTGELTSDNIRSLNLNNTNLTSLNIIKNLKNLGYLDLNNNNINNFDEIKDNYTNEESWIYIIVSDETTEYSMDIEELNKITEEYRITIDGVDYVNVNLKDKNFTEYISNNWNLKKYLIQTIGIIEEYKMENGTIDKRINNITYEDESKPFVLKSKNTWRRSIRIYK